MMTQEEYIDVIALHRQGWTIKQIADALNRHPATISKWIEAGGPLLPRMGMIDCGGPTVIT